MPLSSFKFCKIGDALYGPAWQAPLAKALNRGARTLRHWINKDNPIPDGIGPEIAKLCREKAAELIKIADELEGKTCPQSKPAR